MYFLGQLNNRFDELIEKIAQMNLKNETILLCGNIEIHDISSAQNNIDFKTLNIFLNERSIMLYAIRGNHDNPNLFDSTFGLYSNIVLLKDFSVIGKKQKILAFGGGISVDRIERNKQGLYWENERTYYPFSTIGEFQNIEIIATHKPPPYIFDEILDDFLDYWVKGDACLENQLGKERDESRRFISKLKKSNNIKLVISSHLNKSFNKEIEGINYISLQELELYRI